MVPNDKELVIQQERQISVNSCKTELYYEGLYKVLRE